MKRSYSFVMLLLLPVGVCFAQTSRSTSTTSTSNRQQELYDQYHGIKKKPASPTPSPAPVTPPVANRAKPKQPTSRPANPSPIVTAEPIATTEPTKTINRPQPDMTDGSTSTVRIGFRGGVTYPIFTDTRPFTNPGIGFVGGVTFNVGRGVISFQPEINYTRYSSKNNIGFGSTNLATDFLEVPLFLRIATGTYAGSRFFVNIGPYACYASSASIDGKKIDISTLKGRFGFGAAAGIGAAVKAGPGHVTIEVRGLYSLGDTDNGFSTDANTILGQGTLGYIFPLGGQ